MKVNISATIDIEAANLLNKQDNKSNYIEQLIFKDASLNEEK